MGHEAIKASGGYGSKYNPVIDPIEYKHGIFFPMGDLGKVCVVHDKCYIDLRFAPLEEKITITCYVKNTSHRPNPNVVFAPNEQREVILYQFGPGTEINVFAEDTTGVRLNTFHFLYPNPTSMQGGEEFITRTD